MAYFQRGMAEASRSESLLYDLGGDGAGPQRGLASDNFLPEIDVVRRQFGQGTQRLERCFDRYTHLPRQASKCCEGIAVIRLLCVSLVVKYEDSVRRQRGHRRSKRG